MSQEHVEEFRRGFETFNRTSAVDDDRVLRIGSRHARGRRSDVEARLRTLTDRVEVFQAAGLPG